jgi:hypothetical protein
VALWLLKESARGVDRGHFERTGVAAEENEDDHLSVPVRFASTILVSFSVWIFGGCVKSIDSRLAIDMPILFEAETAVIQNAAHALRSNSDWTADITLRTVSANQAGRVSVASFLSD